MTINKEELKVDGIYLFRNGLKNRFSHFNRNKFPVWYPDGEYSFQDCFVDYKWEKNILKFIKIDGERVF